MNTVIQAALQLRKDVQGGESGSCKGPGARTRLVPISGLQGLCGSVQSLRRVRLYDLMDCSRPGFPVHHQLPELAQTHVHPVDDAIQPSHQVLCTCQRKKNAVLRCSVSGPSQSRAVRLSGEVENLDRTSLASPLL